MFAFAQFSVWMSNQASVSLTIVLRECWKVTHQEHGRNMTNMFAERSQDQRPDAGPSVHERQQDHGLKINILTTTHEFADEASAEVSRYKRSVKEPRFKVCLEEKNGKYTRVG